jgi:predicted glycosyltransferase
MPDKKIVFVAYGGGHINMLIPVIKRLQKESDLELVVLGLTTAGSVLEQQGIPYIGFKDLIRAGDSRAIQCGKKLAGPEVTDSIVPYEESVAYMGLSYVDLEIRYGGAEAEHIYKTKGGRQAFYPLTVLKRFLNEQQPDLVVATNSPRAERAAIAAAGQLGIPAICTVDLFALQAVQWIGRQGYADKICVLSDFVKQNFVRAGRSSDEVVVTGNPAFDRLLEYKHKTMAMRKKKAWSDDIKVILWASQPESAQHPFVDKSGNPELPREVDRVLLAIVSKHPEWRLVIRPHPSETVSYADLPDNVELSLSSEPLYELLSAVDVVVTMSSTVGLEAALLGKHLISLDISIFTEDAPYSKMGIAKGVDSLDNLEGAIQAVLTGDWQCSTALAEIGDATEKVLTVIHEYV